MERVGDLLLEHAAPAGPPRPCPLLLVHGMHGGSWYLRNYLHAAAQEGWDTWALNLRGHWGSRPVADPGRVSVEDYVQDVRDCLDRLGPAAVVGHSMGGLVAQKAAEGGRVRAGVFLTSAAPRGVVALRWPVLARMARYLPALLASRPFTVARADADALILNGLAPERRAWAYGQMVPESGRAAREMALGLIRVDPAAVRCPTLVVGAERDRITPPPVQRRIAARYGARYEEARGLAHMLMLEEGWEGPLKEMLAWLAGAVHGH